MKPASAHQRLFDYANTLEAYLEQLRASQTPDSRELVIFLSFIETHLYLHLTYRDLLTRHLDAATASRARTAHRRLEAYMDAFRQRLADQGPTLPLLEELYHVMYTWTQTHIVQMGQRLVQPIKPPGHRGGTQANAAASSVRTVQGSGPRGNTLTAQGAAPSPVSAAPATPPTPRRSGQACLLRAG